MLGGSPVLIVPLHYHYIACSPISNYKIDRALAPTNINIVVYVEWASRVNFVTIFGDLYQNKLWVICNNLNQFAHLSSASGASNDVIKMAAIVLLKSTYKTSYLKQ